MSYDLLGFHAFPNYKLAATVDGTRVVIDAIELFPLVV